MRSEEADGDGDEERATPSQRAARCARSRRVDQNQVNGQKRRGARASQRLRPSCLGFDAPQRETMRQRALMALSRALVASTRRRLASAPCSRSRVQNRVRVLTVLDRLARSAAPCTAPASSSVPVCQCMLSADACAAASFASSRLLRVQASASASHWDTRVACQLAQLPADSRRRATRCPRRAELARLAQSKCMRALAREAAAPRHPRARDAAAGSRPPRVMQVPIALAPRECEAVGEADEWQLMSLAAAPSRTTCI